MTNEEMARAFVYAKAGGYITDLRKPERCNSQCDTCPASEACTTLLDKKTHVHFLRSYDTYIIPLLEDMGKRLNEGLSDVRD